jgi:hypothetical protein
VAFLADHGDAPTIQQSGIEPRTSHTQLKGAPQFEQNFASLGASWPQDLQAVDWRNPQLAQNFAPSGTDVPQLGQLFPDPPVLIMVAEGGLPPGDEASGLSLKKNSISCNESCWTKA